MNHPQDEVQRHSLEDPESFWAHQADQLHWHRKPSAVLTRTTKMLKGNTQHPHWQWFQDGQISTCYNCVDRHVRAGRGDQPAILYDSPVTGTKQTLTYAQLLDEVEVLAGVLRDECGVRRGDVVLVYMPMIPAAAVAMLAIGRLGALHAVVFGGFAAKSLAQRIEASRPVAVLTASCGIDGNKAPQSYQPLIRGAVALSRHKPGRVLVWQREQLRWDGLDKTAGERNWFKLVRSARARGVGPGACPSMLMTGSILSILAVRRGRPRAS
ncbi:AMP-binding enzyme [Apiospora hydei]|uniref:AMP-binding enzyme n=1 Tax=Apiospora hydei TaxID=1337664 RepID=A0ABR1X373_9PEZI